ncbi:MAG: twin-arginine translocase subunit TatC [Planctomycetota bacterium]|nr:twin-arginine translocase subunit TatC [Planctomycetota bacterium]MDA1251840.1 twin-arginine translocase subunit TatC [Planctomycetota bacterium]
MAQSQDLFDDSTMTFGEHLEVLRYYLIRAIIGLVIFVGFALYKGQVIVGIVRAPIDSALRAHGEKVNFKDDLAVEDGPEAFSTEWWKQLADWDFPDAPPEEEVSLVKQLKTNDPDARTIQIEVLPSELVAVLHAYDPQKYSDPVVPENEKTVPLRIADKSFAELESVVIRQNQAVTLNVQEAFLMYLKVALIAGFVMGSPWVIYQIWQFVAAGLYPHERKYVYIYLPMSTILFLVGVVFCFYAVFPFVLNFLLGFNALLKVQPQIRLSEWVSFAVTLPMMFGVSFQLPLVMLFLERISIFDVTGYREKRRMAVLVIAFLSMMLTPADPMSMLLMMIPLVILYEFGIILCGIGAKKSGFDDKPTDSPYASGASS